MQRGEKLIARGPVVFGQTQYKRKGKKELSDVEISKANLSNELKSYPDNFPVNTRYQLIDEISKYEQFKYMNMKTLASVLAFINQYNLQNVNLDPKFFTAEYIDYFLNILIPDIKENPEKVIKYKETFLRYLRTILFFRKEQQ